MPSTTQIRLYSGAPTIQSYLLHKEGPKTQEMAIWFLLMMLTACAAVPEDLSKKKLSFPEETDTDFAKLTPSQTDFPAATVCLRFITDLRRDYTLFSMATTGAHNALLLLKDKKSNRDVLRFAVNNMKVEYEGLDFELNKWHSFCATWDSVTGLTQVWFNGKPTIEKYIGGPAISSPIIILGQDQDNYGGGFAESQSFVGMMCDVHMWDHVITPCEIKDYMDEKPFTPNKNPTGNLLDWESLTYEITGRVLVKEKEIKCMGKSGPK